MSAAATLIQDDLHRLDYLLVEKKKDLHNLADRAIEKANNDQHISGTNIFGPWVHEVIKTFTEIELSE